MPCSTKSTRGRVMEPPLPLHVLAARNKEMKRRLSKSSLVLGGVGPDMRDWSLSSTQPRPVGSGAHDPAQLKVNLAIKKALQTAQIVLGEDNPEWGSSNIMPAPAGDIAWYRGKLNKETGRFIKASSIKLGSLQKGSQVKTSASRDGLALLDHEASVEIFNSNRSLHNRLRDAGRTTQITDRDGKDCVQYESSNAMPDLTNRLQNVKPAANQDFVRGVRKSNVVLGDGRIKVIDCRGDKKSASFYKHNEKVKTLTTTQHDSIDEIVLASSKMEPGFNARTKKDSRFSSIVLGDGAENEWTTSNAMPNWYAPETYERDETCHRTK